VEPAAEAVADEHEPTGLESAAELPDTGGQVADVVDHHGQPGEVERRLRHAGLFRRALEVADAGVARAPLRFGAHPVGRLHANHLGVERLR
jgi:hypothetical protein